MLVVARVLIEHMRTAAPPEHRPPLHLERFRVAAEHDR